MSFKEAFAGPTFTLDLPAFCAGQNDLSADEIILVKAYEEMLRTDLAQCVRHGKALQRLPFCVGSEQIADPRSFWPLLSGLMTAARGQPHGFTSWPDWKEHALQQFSDDPGLAQLRNLQ